MIQIEVTKSLEDYLEAIYMLLKQKGCVHCCDVAYKLDVSKASVSVAMKRLREKGYVNNTDDSGIKLTDEGRKIAEEMYERHNLIAQILIDIGVDTDTAYKDSCKIEHDLSSMSFEKIKEFYAAYKTAVV